MAGTSTSISAAENEKSVAIEMMKAYHTRRTTEMDVKNGISGGWMA